MQKEIVVRITVEIPDSVEQTPKVGKTRKTGKNLSPDFYDKVKALEIGGTLDITKEVKELNSSFAGIKSRISAWNWWTNKQHSTASKYVIVRGQGSTIQVIRVQ